ncbi:MAG TPA: TetR/AcrR family transcriptional regulator [Candidatus Sulfomarinibacteraceae bacterium]|nr:TetR/AcrR family transcriptional regulator [Candidatus Sulfomarinibacteraceae bacterium]
MPRPRFHRLSADKRRRILEAAAKEFAAHGFDGASLNKILGEAQLSKGAAYYYFDNKADLFATTAAFYAEEIMHDVSPVVAELDADNFWPTLIELYQKQYGYYEAQPWAFGVVKAAARVSEQAATDHPTLARLREEIEHDLETLLLRGQAVGAIRSDLPHDLLVRLFMAVDDTIDHWLLENWETLEKDEVQEIAGRLLRGLARFLGTEDAS